jgi:hypothetical protein
MSLGRWIAVVGLSAPSAACWPLILADDVRHGGAPGPRPSDPSDPDPTGPTDPTDPTEPTDPTDPTDPTEVVPLELTGLEPDFGTNGGTREVVLTGRFGPGAEVTFGGVAAVVVDRSRDALTVLAPTTGATGWVDVQVRSQGQQASLPGAFQYFADATGRTGLAGTLYYLEIVGDYWAYPPSDESGGFFAYTEPIDWSMDRLYGAPLGSCVYDTWGPTLPVLPSGAAEGFMDSRFGALRFEPDAVGTFFTDPSGVVVPGTSYDLLALDGDADWPAFDLPDAVTVPPRFAVTEPAIDNGYLPYADRATRIEWTGSGGDYVLIEIWRELRTGGSDHLWCSAPDTGSYTVDPAAWPFWAPNTSLRLKVGRALEAGGVVPTNNGDNRLAGIYWVYGAAYSR